MATLVLLGKDIENICEERMSSHAQKFDLTAAKQLPAIKILKATADEYAAQILGRRMSIREADRQLEIVKNCARFRFSYREYFDYHYLARSDAGATRPMESSFQGLLEYDRIRRPTYNGTQFTIINQAEE